MQTEDKQISPKAGWFLKGNCILVFALVSFLFVMYGYDFTFNPFYFIGLIMIIPLQLVYSYLHYKSVFHNDSGAAKYLTVTNFVLAGLVAFALVTNVGEHIVNQNKNNLKFDFNAISGFVATCIALMVYFVINAFASLNWSKRLRCISLATGPRSFLKNKTLLAFIAIAFTLFSIGASTGDHNDISSGVNADSVPWLPATASNISYYKSYIFTAYEFDIAHDDFVKYADSRHWQLSEITEPVRITRYNFPEITGDQNQTEIYNAYAEVKTGYQYHWHMDNGGGVDVAYDTEKNRAYVRSSPR